MIRIAAASILSNSSMCLCYKDSNKIESPKLDKNIEFYKKHLNCKGIDIHGSEVVSDAAFNIACERLLRMTRHANYQIHNNLIKNKVDFYCDFNLKGYKKIFLHPFTYYETIYMNLDDLEKFLSNYNIIINWIDL